MVAVCAAPSSCVVSATVHFMLRACFAHYGCSDQIVI